MIHWRKFLVLALIGSFFYWPLHDLAQAAPGDLDRVFGTETMVKTSFDGGGFMAAVAIQADEKIVAAGSATGNRIFNSDFALTRYHSDGSLDTSFGAAGKQITDFSGFPDMANGMVIQPNGKIVVAGSSQSREVTESADFALVRYNPNGGLDSTFGAGGKVTTDFSGLSDLATAVALQPDGKIVAAGQSVSGTIAGSDGALARYNQDGSLDSSFGTGGKLVTSSALRFNTIAIRPDGKIVAAGSAINLSPRVNDDFVVMRFNPDGSLDTAFGNNGKTATDFFGLSDFVTSCGVSADGKIIVAGRANRGDPATMFDGDYDFGLARYNDNGSLDPTFGNGGKVLTDFSSFRDWATSITLQPDGKIVAVGQYVDAVPSFKLALVRYNANGSLDSTFGAAGKIATTLDMGGAIMTVVARAGNGKIVVGGAGGFALVRYNQDGSRDTDFRSRGTTTTDFFNSGDQANAVAVQDDGKVIAAGVAQNDNGVMFALARYNLDGNLDPSFGAGGKVTEGFGREIFALLIQPDGRILAGGKESSGKFGLMRFDEDGSPDQSFGRRGRVETVIFGFNEIRALALQRDGRIIAVGTGSSSAFFNSDSRIVIARYNKDGSPDTSFGAGGKVAPPIVSGLVEKAYATGIQPDGKIVVAGSTQNTRSFTRKTILVARYNSDGSPDASFGDAGRVTYANTALVSEAHALAIQPDGKIVVAGFDVTTSPTQNEDFALLRYDPDGDLDSGFGAGGVVVTDFFGRSDIINGLALASGGRIIAAGSSDNRSRDFALAVYKDDGSLDSGFGFNGKVTTSFGISTDDVGSALAIGTDGSIAVAGTSSTFGNNQGLNFAVARYEGFAASASTDFDLCLQDEATGNVLKLNSQTGNYQFITCGAQRITLAGKAKVKLKKSGCLIKLNKVLSDHTLTASINICRKNGTASVTIPANGQTFTITDRDMNGNSCACP